GAAAPTPLTRVSRAARSFEALNESPLAAADNEALELWLLELVHPARLAPTTAAGTRRRIALCRLRPSSIAHPLTLRIQSMSLRDDSAHRVTGGDTGSTRCRRVRAGQVRGNGFAAVLGCLTTL